MVIIPKWGLSFHRGGPKFMEKTENFYISGEADKLVSQIC